MGRKMKPTPLTSGLLEARTIPLLELSPAELGRWRELAVAAVEPNPFFEPEFVVSVAPTVPSRHVGVLVVERGGEWLAALPVRRASSWRRIPVPGTLSWKSSYTYLGVPLLHREWIDPAARTLLEASVHGRRYLGLELLGADGPVAAAIHRAATELGFSRTVLRSYERAALRRRSDPSEYVSVKAKHRRELRRLRDRLSEELGTAVEANEADAGGVAIDEFLRLEGSGWKRKAGTAFASLAGHEAMFRRICHAFGELGRLELFTLEGGGQTLAAKCNLIAGDAVFCFKIAFDEAWARFSPGVQLELANIAFFHAKPRLKWMDSCAEPTNVMINRLWPDRRPIEVTAITGGGAGRATERLFRAAVQTRELIKGGPRA